MGRRMDVAVVGVPKSGTSMLCNAMTDPGRCVVLYEPASDRFRSDRLRAQAASLGYEGRNVLRWARQHSRWGVKEVLSEGIRSAIGWGPAHVVLIVRDLRHVALSTHETNCRIPWDLDIRRRRLIASAREVLAVRRSWPPDGLTVCHYEAFVSSAETRESVRRRIDWPTMGGDVGRGLATWLERPHEADRHGGRITDRSVAYRDAEADADMRRFADEVAAACSPFQETFGYAP